MCLTKETYVGVKTLTYRISFLSSLTAGFIKALESSNLDLAVLPRGSCLFAVAVYLLQTCKQGPCRLERLYIYGNSSFPLSAFPESPVITGLRVPVQGWLRCLSAHEVEHNPEL